MEEPNVKSMGKMALMLLMISGGDITAPKALKREFVGNLNLKNNPEFDRIQENFRQIGKKERLAIVKGIILTQLTPSQMIQLHEAIHDGVTGILGYLNEHPEERGERPDPDEVLESLMS